MFVLADSKKLNEEINTYLNDNLLKINYTINNENLNSYKTFIIHYERKERCVEAPSDEIKKIQRSILKIFSRHIAFTDEVHGYVKKRSIITNALAHLGATLVINLDIKNFFHSIQSQRVYETLIDKPFSMSNTSASLISNIATFSIDSNLSVRILPLGSPLSSFLTNIICHRLDKELIEIVQKYNLKYTRYADDMTFSNSSNAISIETLEKIKGVIKSNNFEINEEKTRIHKKPSRLEVTGIIINEKLNVKRRYLKVLRAVLHNWEQNGIEKAMSKYYVCAMKNNRNYDQDNFLKMLKGKIEFMGMVRGKEDKYYEKYLNRLDELKSKKDDYQDYWSTHF